MSWTIGNYALSQAQMNANAVEVYKYFSGRGWSLNAIAGILGNMQSESYVNPGVWQSLNEGNYSGRRFRNKTLSADKGDFQADYAGI